MAWDVDFHSQFVPEFEALDEEVQDELFAHVDALKVFGSIASSSRRPMPDSTRTSQTLRQRHRTDAR